MSIYNEIEPAYLLGEFSLESAAHGFVVCPPQPLRLRAPEPAEPNESHSDAIEGVSWLTRGIGFGGADVRSGDAAPYLIIDLGKKVVVDRLKIWNYNERNLTRRGVKTMTVYTSPTADFNDPNKEELQTVTLKEGSSSGPQIVSLEGKRALPENQYLIFEIKSNWAGVEYPAPEKDWSKMPDRDCGFVGLSEVRFYSANPENLPSVPMSDTRSPEEEAELKRKTESGIPMYLEIKNVKIAKVSSELALGGFDRAAAHLLDGSGLEAATFEQGWNRQGMPFYAAGVSYKETFDLGQMMQCQYFVNLPDSPKGWYGATAKVIVNGKTAGYVMSAPWKVEITKLVRAGKNEIEVVVFGTPKNLLGPHHNGSGRGTAWPGMFWRGPEPQCPGADYDTIGYGLFEPFRVTREWAANP